MLHLTHAVLATRSYQKQVTFEHMKLSLNQNCEHWEAQIPGFILLRNYKNKIDFIFFWH